MKQVCVDDPLPNNDHPNCVPVRKKICSVLFGAHYFKEEKDHFNVVDIVLFFCV